MKKGLTLTLSVEDWSEIVAALYTKERRIKAGDYGPEDIPGEDNRWTSHLQAIKRRIERFLYAPERGRTIN